MNNFIIIFNNAYYSFVRLYTYISYYLIKLYNYFYNKYSVNKEIIFVKDGIEYNDAKSNIIFEYDFIIYIVNMDDMKTYNILSREYYEKINKNILLETYNPVKVDYKFTLVKLYTNDNSYDITNILKDKNNYLYMENNRLFDHNFLLWFYKNILKLPYNENDYIVAFDSIFNKNVIDSKKCIILNKNDYSLI